MDQPRLHRPHHVGGIGAAHRGDDRVDLQEIAHSDPGALLLERRRARVLAMDQGAHIQAECDRLLDCGPAGVAGGTRDQYGSGGGRSWHSFSMQCAVPM